MGLKGLVDEQCHNRDQRSLDEIHGSHTCHHEAYNAAFLCQRIDLGTHCQDGIQRHSVEFGERGKQIYGIECGAKYGHDQCTGNAGKDGIFLSFLKGIHSGSGDDQAAAHHEVRQIADESGRRTFMHSFSSIFTNSIMTPATGPKAKEPTKIGSSLKSIL